MEREYDLVVIGTGSAGTSCVTECARAGWRVAVVDERPYGGTCLLRGCDPKKVLVGAAELADWARRMHDAGVATGTLGIDWPGLMRFKRTFTEPAPAAREREFREAGIECLHGTARFISQRVLRVGNRELNARHILIASGAKPVPLGIDGEEILKTSEDFLSLEVLPRRIVFVGGGFIGFEFAYVAARCGASVRIIEQASRPLRRFDGDLVQRLVEATRELGIDVLLETKAIAFEQHGAGVTVRAQSEGKELTFTCDAVVHGGGRVPDLDALDLDSAGIARTNKGVKVNEFLQSVGNPAVYAAGDAADGGGSPLTPVASAEGEAVAYNLLNGNARRVDFTGLASMVYTIPALASVGLSEEAAHEKKLAFDVHAAETSQWYSSRRVNEKRSAYKVLTEKSTGHILGAHIMGPCAEEVVNIFSLAIRANIPASTLKDALFAYPTGASDIAYML